MVSPAKVIERGMFTFPVLLIGSELQEARISARMTAKERPNETATLHIALEIRL
jgi:hypothetical protein